MHMTRIWRSGIGMVIAVVSALAVSGFGGGMAFAATPAPVASIAELTGGSTSVALSSGFVTALRSLHVTPAPSGRATVTGGVAKFPITGGHVTVYKPGQVDPYVQGRISHQGSGLRLTKGPTTVTLQNFVIDPGKPAVLTGEVLAGGHVLAASTTLFDLDGSTLKPITTNTRAGTATLTGTTVTLAAGAATALNRAFKTTAFHGGTIIGIATIVVDLPRHRQ